MRTETDDKALAIKRQALKPLLQGFVEGYYHGLTPPELHEANRVYKRLIKYEWYRQQFCKRYLHLGQFQHLTLTLPPREGREPLTDKQQDQLVDLAIQLIKQAVGPDYVSAYRIVPEYQVIDDRFHPFHLHIALPIHLFRASDQEAAQRVKPEDSLMPHVLERFFSVPPLILTGKLLSRFEQGWIKGVEGITDVRADDVSDLVRVTFCRHYVQDADDRRRIGLYHADTLKELKYDIAFQYRRKKRDVSIVRVGNKHTSHLFVPDGRVGRRRRACRLTVPEFVRRYVVRPMEVHSNARLIGALRKGPFATILANASKNGVLDHPIKFFQLIGEGISWAKAERATSALMAKAERRRPPAIEREPERTTDWEAIYMRPGSPEEW